MKMYIIKADITKLNVDAIVLPANPQLKKGAGASQAIFEKAGEEELRKKCKSIAPIDVGSAIPTGGYNLPSEFIIHAAVPRWVDGGHNEYVLLSSAYLSSLKVADRIGVSSVAFPLLSAGNNGFDPRVAFYVAQKTIESFKADKTLKDVYLTIYDKTAEALIMNLGYEIADTPEKILFPEIGLKKEPFNLKKEVAEAVEIAINNARKMWDDNKEEIIRNGMIIAMDAVKRLLK